MAFRGSQIGRGRQTGPIQDGRRDVAGGGENGKAARHPELSELRHQHEAAAVHRIGQHPAEDQEHDGGDARTRPMRPSCRAELVIS